MMLIMGQSNRIWSYWAGKYPGSVGRLIGPCYGKKVPIDDWMPFVLDNDAYQHFLNKTPFDFDAWRRMMDWVKSTGVDPLWAAVPDVVGNREATLLNWELYSDEIINRGWKAAFVVQDGMTPADIPLEASVVFIGGTDEFKWGTLQMWCDNFPRVHCGRVNPISKIELCEAAGCESVDGTGWFRDPTRPDKLPAIQRYKLFAM